jgi:hypothetical protein
MEQEELQRAFDQKSASGYDRQWSKSATLWAALHRLLGAALSEPRAGSASLVTGNANGSENR